MKCKRLQTSQYQQQYKSHVDRTHLDNPCWLDSELYTNVMNELLAVTSMVERRTGYSYELKHNTGWGYGFITILTRDKYGNFLRPEDNI